MPVSFHYQKVILINSKTNLKAFVQQLFKSEGKEMGSINFIFCSNTYLLKINKEFLQHDYFTDIITFDMSDGSSDSISGEIYISVDMIKSNAKDFQVPFSRELYRVMFHGLLHLCGYKDKSSKDKKIMSEKEDLYLKMFHGEH